jgi:S1-C subfamily serine protease
VGRIERPLLRAATLLAAGLVGGAFALGGAAALGRLGGATTVREVIAAGDFRTPAALETADGLSIGEIYRRASPGVVQVQAPGSEGSGWVFDKTGHIVTNYHLVRGADAVDVSFSNNESVRARLVGVDPSTDVALLKVSTPARGLTPLSLGRSSDVHVGDAVVAIGNPFGYERAVTAGIVSAIGRVRRAAIDEVIQTDAPINRRHAGGPLLNADGQVIGVNTIDLDNVGVAIPIDTVKSVTAQLIRSGKVEHAFLGVHATPLTGDVARLFGLPARGLLVGAVVPASAAAKAGIRPGRRRVIVEGESWRLGGDVIVRADGRQVTTVEDLRAVIARKRPGDSIELEVVRDGEKRVVTAELGRAPASPAQ